ncbi:putative clathrin coat assembly protein, partial [Operophtera brumata]
MAFNPFLSMNEPAALVTTEELNPFMMTNAEPVTFDNADNPFAASNPFTDFGVGGFNEPSVGDTVPVDIFGGVEPTGVGAKQFTGFEADATMDIFGSQPVKPTELELITTTADAFPEDVSIQQQPMCPLPPETQNLILSVTGQMEFNSSHLLDRIPLTRTPSPVSVRDIHSPSPTPEPDMELELELEPQEEPPPVVENADTTRAKPARPPPARPPVPPPVTRPPPPRPAPPPVPPMAQRQSPSQNTDDINLFDAPAPVVIKPTKEAILSLYSAPKKEVKQIDFLSDDIMESMTTDSATEPPPSFIALESNAVSTVTATTSELVFEEDVAGTAASDVLVSAAATMFPPATGSLQQAVAPMDCSEPPIEGTPVNNTSPFADYVVDGFEVQPEEIEKNPFETEADTTTAAFTSPGANIFGIDKADSITTGNNVFGMDNDAFGAATAAEAAPVQTNIFGTTSSPFDDNTQTDAFSTGNENIFGVSQPPISSPFDDSRVNAFTTDGADDNIFGVNQPVASAELDWGDASEAMVQDAFPDGHDTFPDAHDTFPNAHDTFPDGQDAFPDSQDAFDAFSAKFDSTSANHKHTSAWGDDGGSDEGFGAGFEAEAFDTFLSMGAPPPPAATPRLEHEGSRESTDDTFSVFIRPKDSETSGEETAVPVLAPPPRPQAMPESPRVNPFDKSGFEVKNTETQFVEEPRRASGSETPPTPLFDDDVSQPLEDFPRTTFWKKIFVRLTLQGDNPVVQLFNAAGDKEPFQELPLQACYSVSEVGAQQFDQFGKIFTVKLQPGQVTKAERITNKLSQFAAYAIQGDYQGVKEFGSDLRKLGLPVEHAPQVLGSDLNKPCLPVEHGPQVLGSDLRKLGLPVEHAPQVLGSDLRKLGLPVEHTPQVLGSDLRKLGLPVEHTPQVLGSDLRKLGLPVEHTPQVLGSDLRKLGLPDEHAPQVSQLFKIGSLNFEDVKQFSCCVEEALFRLSAHRDRALTYKMEEVQITAVDELYVEQDAEGSVLKQIARVRVFFIGFLSGMPDVELGVNDMRRQGKEVVGRHDIIPVVTEEWIRVEKPEFHACVQPEDFTASQIIKFKPPDACYIELMRFRIRPPKNRELPLQLKALWCVTGNKNRELPLQLKALWCVTGNKNRELPLQLKALWRTGKIKGIERFLGAVDVLQESLIEVTSGQAKYEHQHRAIVWRMPRLPKEGQ